MSVQTPPAWQISQILGWPQFSHSFERGILLLDLYVHLVQEKYIWSFKKSASPSLGSEENIHSKPVSHL